MDVPNFNFAQQEINDAHLCNEIHAQNSLCGKGTLWVVYFGKMDLPTVDILSRVRKELQR